MLIYLGICVLAILGVQFLNAEDCHNIFLKGRTDYKVEFSVQDDDIEMVRKEQLIPYKIKDTENKFDELNKLSHREYCKMMRSKSVVRTYYKDLERPLVPKSRKRFHSQTASSNHLKHKRQVDLDTDTDYNYDDLLYEYYAEAIDEEKSNETYHIVTLDTKASGLMDLLKRTLTLNMKIDEKSNHSLNREVLAQRIWKISQIYLLIYILVAIPLWCTMGWCCCCLCCKCFKAHETIEDARRYFIWNPPGILRVKTGDIVYEPSEKERETYEEFEHLIKTL